MGTGQCTLNINIGANATFINVTAGEAYVPTTGEERTPMISDTRSFLGTLIPQLGTATNAHRINTLYWALEDLAEIVDEALKQLEEGTEIKAVATVAMQNRVALDGLYAERGGMCVAVGIDHCCTYIPDETGNWTQVREKVKQLKDSLVRQGSPNSDIGDWLTSGSWSQILKRIGVLILICLFVFAIVCCCIIPMVRSMLSRALANTTPPGMYYQNLKLSPYRPRPEGGDDFQMEMELRKGLEQEGVNCLGPGDDDNC